jgi:hypothetical protein
MTALRFFLMVSTAGIYLMTLAASANHGINWPAVAVIYLLLVATWISWREGFTAKGHTFGFLSVVMGGMFTFPYLLYATYRAGGDPKEVLLGGRSA